MCSKTSNTFLYTLSVHDNITSYNHDDDDDDEDVGEHVI